MDPQHTDRADLQPPDVKTRAFLEMYAKSISLAMVTYEEWDFASTYYENDPPGARAAVLGYRAGRLDGYEAGHDEGYSEGYDEANYQHEIASDGS